MFTSLAPLQVKWILPGHGVIKINTYIAFGEGKIGIGFLSGIIWVHILIIIQAVPRDGNYALDYGELLGIIEGYVAI